MTRENFFSKLSLAGDNFLKRRPKPVPFSEMSYDGDILSVAKAWDLDGATGSPANCPISCAIASAAWCRDNPMKVFAHAEEAWVWEQRRLGIKSAMAA